MSQCNQTKDRPCSNCARRYPPVACTYLVHESGSPRTSRYGPRSTAYAVSTMESTDSSCRRGSPSEHIGDLPDRGRITPTINEQMVASDRSHERSNSAYGSLGSPADYSPLALEQPVFPDSPDLFYSQMQAANYPQQNQYATVDARSSFYASTSSGAYGSTIPAPSTAVGGQGYPSYYVPVSTAQANWSPVPTESPNFVVLSGTYGTLGDLPLEPSPPNADLYQFCEPDNPQ